MYILKCANGCYYTGSTTNLEKRLEQHKNGEGANFTKKHLPVELVYAEEFARIEDAFYREKQIQGWSRKKKEALIAGNFNKLHELAECKNDTKSITSTTLCNRASAALSNRASTTPATMLRSVGERSRTVRIAGRMEVVSAK